MVVLICGSRDWTDEATMRKIMATLTTRDVVIEGGARGADRMAGFIADQMSVGHARVEARWDAFGPGAGPIRNRWMLDLKPDEVWAFHENLNESKGTKDCVTAAKNRGIHVKVFP